MNINKLLTKAIQVFEAGNIEESKKYLLLVIKLDSNNFFAYNYLGLFMPSTTSMLKQKSF